MIFIKIEVVQAQAYWLRLVRTEFWAF